MVYLMTKLTRRKPEQSRGVAQAIGDRVTMLVKKEDRF
jgi:hypothetical protein